MDKIFIAEFKGKIPTEITPEQTKKLKIRLNDIVNYVWKHPLQKGEVKRVVMEYLHGRGYEQEFVKNYQKTSKPQWVLRLKN